MIGAGAMGSSACLHLARRGRKVLALDRFDIPNRQASHHGRSRLIRLAYFEHPDYVRLLRRAHESWYALERDTAERLLHVTGGLYLGPPESDLVVGSREAARVHDLPHDVLDATEVMRRWPQFRIPPDWVGFREPDGGFLVPENAIAAQADLATRHGAEIHAGEAVRSWRVVGETVVVETEHAEYEAGQLVLTAGAWTGPLAGELGVPLRVTRQTLAWFAPPEPGPFALGAFPCWAIDPVPRGQPHGLFYGFPVRDEQRGLKVALHRPGEECDPDEVDRGPHPEETEQLAGMLRRWLPGADGPLVHECACLYTSTPDGHFVVDRHPQSDRVVVAAGFSGHGFKFASVLGEAIADLVIDGRTDLPVDFLSLARFA